MRVVLLAMLLGGCGYHLRGELKPPAGVRSVHVPTFANKTYEPGLELPFTERIRTELARGRGARLVTDRGDADAVLTGEVLTFRAVPTVLVRNTEEFGSAALDRLLPRRYRAIVEIRISLLSVATGEVLWQDVLEGAEEYGAGDAPEGFEPLAREALQSEAIARMAEDLMREAYDRIMSDF